MLSPARTAHRSPLVIAVIGVLAALAPAAHAGSMSASAHVVSLPHDGRADVVAVCEASAPDAVYVTVSCDVYDGAGNPPVHDQVALPSPFAVAVVVATNQVMPVTYCVTVTATFRDQTSQTVTQCGHAGA